MTSLASLRRALLVAALLALVPATASAAPGSLGSGGRPAIAMDGAGTAYVAWIGVQPTGNTTLHFCRLPRGATACANPTTTFTPPGTSITAPFVAVDGATVRILSYRYGGDVAPDNSAVFLFESTNGGDTFDAGKQVGTVPFRDAAVGPGGGFSLVTSAFSGGGVYQRVPADGAPKATTSAQLSNTHVYEGAVGLADAATPVVTLTEGNGNGKVWYCEACTGSKDPNVLGNWLGGNDIGIADDAHFASGPSGLFLKTSDSLTGGNLIVRKYAGAGTFGAPVTVPNATGEHPQSHITQDAAGRLHLVWPRIEADAPRLYYATSDDGANWLQGALHAGEPFYQVRVAAAPDHVGLAVWDTGASSNSEVHFLPLGPTPPSPPVQETPTTIAQPTTYQGPVRPVRVSDRNATYTLGVPRNCVQPGQRFRVTLKWRRKKRKGNLFVKVRRSDFYLGTRVVKKDTKAPFVHTYTVLVSAPRGSTISLRARAFIKVRRGNAPKKSIRARVKVCA